MTNSQEAVDAMDSEELAQSWYVRITHCRQIRYQEAVLSNAKFLETYWHLWDPGVSLRFVSSWNDGELILGFEASGEGFGPRRLLENLSTALHAIQPWLGLGEVTETRPWPSAGPVQAAFTAERPDRALIVSTHSLAWRADSRIRGTWQFTVDLLAPEDADGTLRPDTDENLWTDDKTEGNFRSGAGSTVSGAVAHITLRGQGEAGPLLTALLCSDSAQNSRLTLPAPGAPSSHELGTTVPGTLLAHLLSTPARVGRLLPEHTAEMSDEFFSRMEAAPTPHALLIGASGQGKSTALGAIGARSLACGRIVIAVDVHDGDLLRRQYEQALAMNRPALYIDCTPSDDRAMPALRWTDPPTGVTADQHVENLWTMLRYDVWADMPAEFFGPVGQRITMAALALAVKDPARQFSLSQFPMLIDPANQAFRRAVLHRVGDPEATRVIQRDVMPMVTAKDPDNSFSWIVSKFGPLASPVVRGILEGSTNLVPIEEALRHGYSLFLHAPAGDLGDDPARTIAAVFLHRVWAAVRRHAPSAEVVLLLDELQKYASQLTSTVLAEARKYGVRLVAAHQNLAQLRAPIREALLANTGAIGCYRLGPADAAHVDGLFPTIPVRQLQTLPRHTLALTTFDSDLITAGPLPLPEPSLQIPEWDAQVINFWDGPEPLTGDEWVETAELELAAGPPELFDLDDADSSPAAWLSTRRRT